MREREFISPAQIEELRVITHGGRGPREEWLLTNVMAQVKCRHGERGVFEVLRTMARRLATYCE